MNHDGSPYGGDDEEDFFTSVHNYIEQKQLHSGECLRVFRQRGMVEVVGGALLVIGVRIECFDA